MEQGRVLLALLQSQKMNYLKNRHERPSTRDKKVYGKMRVEGEKAFPG